MGNKLGVPSARIYISSALPTPYFFTFTSYPLPKNAKHFCPLIAAQPTEVGWVAMLIF